MSDANGGEPSRPVGALDDPIEVEREDATPAASDGEATDSPASPATPPTPRSRRRRRLKRGGIALAVLVIVILGSTYGYVTYRNDQIGHVKVKGEASIPKTGVENILLVGSTSRCALDNKQTGAFGSCAQGVTGVNSDVIMVLRLDPVHHRVAILSFPRDTFIPNARPGLSNRIDSALAYGPSQLVSAVEQDFGIPINHYVELNFDSFQGVVAALGGLKMYFPYPVYDQQSGLKVNRRGCQPLGKFQALALVRARHMYYKINGHWVYDGSGDLGRIIRDHEFLRVLASAVAKRGLGNPITDNDLLGAVAPNLVVDGSFTLQHMANLTLTYRGVDPNTAPQTTIPVIVDTSFSYMYKGFNYGSIVFPTEPQDTRTIRAFMGKANAGTHVNPSTITVAVDGGMAQPSATATTARELTALGYKVTGTKEILPVGPIAETQVLYAPGHLADGQRVLDSLTGVVALGENTAKTATAVTVVTGSDFTVRAKTTRSAQTTASTSSIPAALTSVSGPLTTPTSANESLPSYDPRGCPQPKQKKA